MNKRFEAALTLKRTPFPSLQGQRLGEYGMRQIGKQVIKDVPTIKQPGQKKSKSPRPLQSTIKHSQLRETAIKAKPTENIAFIKRDVTGEECTQPWTAAGYSLRSQTFFQALFHLTVLHCLKESRLYLFST